MKIRKLAPDEYTLVKQWWQARIGTCPAPWLLSQYGYLAETSLMPVAALFLFPTIGTTLCFIGWPISNPLSDKEERSVALDALFLYIEGVARKMNYKQVVSYSSSQSVSQRLKSHSYTLGDSSVEQYIKEL